MLYYNLSNKSTTLVKDWDKSKISSAYFKCQRAHSSLTSGEVEKVLLPDLLGRCKERCEKLKLKG